MQNILQELESREIRAWQDLIRVLAHEIMNSLTPISSLSRSASQLLQPLQKNSQAINPQTLDDIGQAMETIARRSDGLLNFVDSYRSLARLPTPKPEYIRIHTLFENTLTLMQADLATANITVTTTVNPKELSIFADPELLSQALINLTKNARDALNGQTDAKITLNARQNSRNNALLEISDNGCGIKQADLEKIWIPFFSTKNAGTGIGLSLTRQIINLHGGSIQMYSDLGQETRVVIVLPST